MERNIKTEKLGYIYIFEKKKRESPWKQKSEKNLKIISLVIYIENSTNKDF